MFRFMPGKAPPVRTVPYSDEELGAHDRKVAKYFVAGGFFLVLGAVHMVVKNVPWVAVALARTGYAGHLVRDLSNTHVMIVGGGTLLATGLCWICLPRIVGRPLASEALAQCAFWFTAIGLAIFYVSLIGNGIAIGRLVEHGWDYQVAKNHMGKWYKVPTGMGAGIMGLGYWCFAANVGLTVFQSRLVRVPKPQWHLWKFLATGAATLTVGTVQGVIQVQPHNADWLYKAGHAGEWIDPISHAHINLVTGLTMLVAGSLFSLVPLAGGERPSRRVTNACFWSPLAGGGEAGDVIVNLHAQLNMLAGLMVILVGLALVTLGGRARVVVTAVPAGIAVYYAGGLAFSAVEAHRVAAGRSFADSVRVLEPWQALVLVPAALAVLVGFFAFARAVWRLTEQQRAEGRAAIAAAPGLYTGKIPKRVRRRSPAALAAYELPLGLMGFPGMGWLFAGFPFTASILLCAGPALA